MFCYLLSVLTLASLALELIYMTKLDNAFVTMVTNTMHYFIDSECRVVDFNKLDLLLQHIAVVLQCSQ